MQYGRKRACSLCSWNTFGNSVAVAVLVSVWNSQMCQEYTIEVVPQRTIAITNVSVIWKARSQGWICSKVLARYFRQSTNVVSIQHHPISNSCTWFYYVILNSALPDPFEYYMFYFAISLITQKVSTFHISSLKIVLAFLHNALRTCWGAV